MKKVDFSIIAMFISLFLIGCGGTKPTPVLKKHEEKFACQKNGVNAPFWTCDAHLYNNQMLVGVGSADANETNATITRKEAYNSAVIDFSFLVKEETKNKIQKLAQDNNLSSERAVDLISAELSKQIVAKTNSLGQLEFWRSPKAVYILVGASKNAVNIKLKEVLTDNENIINKLKAIIAAEKAAAEKAATEKAEAEKAATEKAEAEKAATEKAATEKAATEKLATEKLATEKAEAEKAATEKAEADKLATEKAEVQGSVKIEKMPGEEITELKPEMEQKNKR
jgi:hypothetical protein